MDGPVTIGLVSVCATVCAVVLGAFAYISRSFQSKTDADDIKQELSAATSKLESDMKRWIQRVEDDVTRLQSSLERIGENVSYIRGRLEEGFKTKE